MTYSENDLRKYGSERYPEPGGVEMLEALVGFVRRFVACSSSQADAIALWIAHTWAMPAAITTARLSVQSAEKMSGKTRLLEVLDLLTPGPLSVANISPAALFRVISEGPVTLLVDECDAIFNPKSNTEDLRALLNAGYRRGATVARVVGEGKKMSVKQFPVFAPVALAGIGTLPDTITDRSIVIRLRRRAPDEVVARLRRRVVEPEAEKIVAAVKDWTTAHLDELTVALPSLPDELGDRQADVWEPLLAIADAVGGPWPVRARDCAHAMCRTQNDDDGSLGVRLLADCREAFGIADRLPTATLLERLAGIEEAPWGDWYGKPVDARFLAKKLRPFDVRSGKHRFGDRPLQGYLASDFHDAWGRYLPPQKSGTSGTSGTPQVSVTSTVPDVPHVPDFQGVGSEGPEPCDICSKPCRRRSTDDSSWRHSVCEVGTR